MCFTPSLKTLANHFVNICEVLFLFYKIQSKLSWSRSYYQRPTGKVAQVRAGNFVFKLRVRGWPRAHQLSAGFSSVRLNIYHPQRL